MFKFISVLVLLTFSLYVLGQDPSNQVVHPLCGAQGTAGKEIFADDPASCHSYLFCQWNPENLTQLIAVHQLDCRNQNSNHYQPDATDPQIGTCVETRANCTGDNMFFCPDLDVMAANPLDPDCRQYRPCRLPGMAWLTCRSPLVFNRNTGACDHATNAPCGPIVNSPSCPPLGTGKFPGRFCWSYIFCFEGNQHGDEFDCPTGWKFDEAEGECVEDPAGECIREAFEFIPPRVKNGVSRKQKEEINIKIEGLNLN